MDTDPRIYNHVETHLEISPSVVKPPPGFACMEHGALVARILNSSCGADGNKRKVMTGRGSLNLPYATRHLVIEASAQLPPADKQSPT